MLVGSCLRRAPLLECLQALCREYPPRDPGLSYASIFGAMTTPARRTSPTTALTVHPRSPTPHRQSGRVEYRADHQIRWVPVGNECEGTSCRCGRRGVGGWLACQARFICTAEEGKQIPRALYTYVAVPDAREGQFELELRAAAAGPLHPLHPGVRCL